MSPPIQPTQWKKFDMTPEPKETPEQRAKRLKRAVANAKSRMGGRRLMPHDPKMVQAIKDLKLTCDDGNADDVEDWDVKNCLTVVENADSRTAEFNIDGYIWSGSAAEFRTQLKEAGDVAKIRVDINSPGGSFADSVEIFAMLAQHKAHVTTRAVGNAASGGSIILQAGDERVACSTCTVMVHEVQPTEKEIKSFLERVQAANEVLRQLYVDTNTAGLDEDGITTIFEAGDYYMNGEQAVEEGFADTFEKIEKATKNDSRAAIAASRFTVEAAKLDTDKILDLVASGISAVEKKRKPAGQSTTTPATSTNTNQPKSSDSRSGDAGNSSTPTASRNGESSVFEKWLKAQGLSDEQIKNLTDGQRQSWQAIYNGLATGSGEPNTGGLPIRATGSDDGNMSGGEDVEAEMTNRFLAHRRLLNLAEEHLSEWPDLMETAIKEKWSPEKIENEALKKENEALKENATNGQGGVGRDWAPIVTGKTSGGPAVDDVIECALALSLETPVDALTGGLYRRADGSDMDVVEKSRLGYSELGSFDDATVEAAIKFNRRCANGGIGMRELANVSLDRDPFCGIDLSQELMNAFSQARMVDFVRKATNRRLIANQTEMPFAYRNFVNVINGTFRETERYRAYTIGDLEEVPKGGGVNKGNLDSAESYKTKLGRHAKNYTVDEMWFEDGDFGAMREMINKATIAGRRAPELQFFGYLEKHLAKSGLVAFTQEWFDAAWEVWCNATIQDKKDPNNKAGGSQVYVDGPRMAILGSKFDALRLERMFMGSPMVAGGPTSKVEIHNVLNIYSKYATLSISPRVPKGKMAILPEANEEAPAFTMTVRNGVEVPQAVVFPGGPENFGITVRIQHYFNIDQADPDLVKSQKDVADFIAAP